MNFREESFAEGATKARAELTPIIDDLKASNTEQAEKINEQDEKINEQDEKINDQAEQINELKDSNAKLKDMVVELKAMLLNNNLIHQP